MFQTLTARPPATTNPWHALWTMMVGFFMILVDATIVAVANPSIMAALGADYDAVIWVTSAYLLAYAVPLLVAGRLGDRFGTKNLYLIGLAVFTAASLWCGLAGSIEMLIAARVVQGIGAALLTPQTLSTITRIFPPQRRGVAMSVWGTTAGVATLVGPLAGGVLVDTLGWQWIFFVNVPVGIIGVVLAVRLLPVLATDTHRFDILGVVLSGVGMFLIVFALQEGQSASWQPWIWATITAGVGLMAGFVYWQAVNKNEPLIPLQMFRDRDFSLAGVGIATIGFVVTAMILPLMFYAQAVCGLSPTRSALLIAPMAVATGVLAPFVGRIVDRSHPRPVVGFGFATLAIALTWLSIEMTAATPIWRLVLPITAMGVGMAFIWSPLGATATRNLPLDLAGAGSGVFNTTRQAGGVLGSASMAAVMTAWISVQIGSSSSEVGGTGEASATRLPGFLREPFAAAMSQSMLLPAFVALAGVVAALFLLGRESQVRAPSEPVRSDDLGDHEGFVVDDDDEYLEYTVTWDGWDPAPVAAQSDEDTGPLAKVPTEIDDDTGPLAKAPAESDNDTRPLARAPAEARNSGPVEPWRSILDQLLADMPAKPAVEPAEVAHNRFLVDQRRHFQPVHPATSNGRHSRTDADDASTYGRHSRRSRD